MGRAISRLKLKEVLRRRWTSVLCVLTQASNDIGHERSQGPCVWESLIINLLNYPLTYLADVDSRRRGRGGSESF